MKMYHCMHGDEWVVGYFRGKTPAAARAKAAKVEADELGEDMRDTFLGMRARRCPALDDIQHDINLYAVWDDNLIILEERGLAEKNADPGSEDEWFFRVKPKKNAERD